MNKSIISVSLCALCAGSLMAAPVNKKTAETVALNFVSHQPGAPADMSVKSIEYIDGELYMVNFAPKGFAIVAADDTSDPIIGYSTESSMSKTSMPENMSYMLSEAAQAVQINRSKGNTPNRLWNSYVNGAIVQSRDGERVEPLIQVNWNQSAPYNKYCPGSGANKAIVGCVAVAMSQAMSVQRYPAKPSGANTYNCAGYGEITIDYDKEKAYDWNAILSGANQNDETARLLYHAGVSVNMGYGSDGSGIPSDQVYRITDALKEHFGYGTDVTYNWQSQYKGDWNQLLLNELYADRAVIYNAVDSKGGYGHSFNIDGYDGEERYHVNWGWGGYGNGYFRINSLADAQMNMNYDTRHVAVTGIGGSNSSLRRIQLSDLYVEAGLPADSYVCTLIINGEPINDSEVTVKLTGEYNAGSGSYMDSPFKYKNGMLFTKDPLSLEQGTVYVRVEATMKADSRTKLRQGFYLTIEPHKHIGARSSLKYDRDTKMFTIHTRYGATAKLTNSQGAEVSLMKDPAIPNYTFSRESLTKGTNKLEITLDGEIKVIEIEK